MQFLWLDLVGPVIAHSKHWGPHSLLFLHPHHPAQGHSSRVLQSLLAYALQLSPCRKQGGGAACCLSVYLHRVGSIHGRVTSWHSSGMLQMQAAGSWLGEMWAVDTAALFWYGESNAPLSRRDSVRANMRKKNEVLSIRSYLQGLVRRRRSHQLP